MGEWREVDSTQGGTKSSVGFYTIFGSIQSDASEKERSGYLLPDDKNILKEGPPQPHRKTEMA
jgi:hypothetical protein